MSIDRDYIYYDVCLNSMVSPHFDNQNTGYHIYFQASFSCSLVFIEGQVKEFPQVTDTWANYLI